MQHRPEPTQFAMRSLPMAKSSQKFLLAAASLQAHTFKAMMRYQIETMSFLKHRYEQDLKLAEELIAGPEFNDTFDVFTTFLQNATTEYASEASKVAALTSKLASETATRVREEATSTIKDMAAKTLA